MADDDRIEHEASVKGTSVEGDWGDADHSGSGDGFWHALRETAIIVVSALVLSAIVRALLVQAFYVPSASMEDTLLISDRIVASKITTKLSGVHRGEIVVFTDPGDWLPDPINNPNPLREAFTFIGLLPSDTGQDLVKRVIGVGGDRVACCDVQGRIMVNGMPLDEPYIKGPTDQVTFDITVPDGSVFVMGDNRGNSRDSRFHLDENKGSVPVSHVVGRVFAVVWPFNRMRVESIPSSFDDVPSPVPSTPAQ